MTPLPKPTRDQLLHILGHLSAALDALDRVDHGVLPEQIETIQEVYLELLDLKANL